MYVALLKAMEFEGGRNAGVILKQRLEDTTGFFYKNLSLLLACFVLVLLFHVFSLLSFFLLFSSFFLTPFSSLLFPLLTFVVVIYSD